MANLKIKNCEQVIKAELPHSLRIAAADNNCRPSFSDFKVTMLELLSVITNWFLAKIHIRKSTKSVELNGSFNRPRSNGAFQVESKMKDELGVAKYRKDLRSVSCSHRR